MIPATVTNPTEARKKIGTVTRTARATRGWEVNELASKSDKFSPKHVNLIENGNAHRVEVSILSHVVRVLGLAEEDEMEIITLHEIALGNFRPRRRNFPRRRDLSRRFGGYSR